MKRYYLRALNARDRNEDRVVGSYDNIFTAYWNFLKKQFLPPTTGRVTYYVVSKKEVAE